MTEAKSPRPTLLQPQPTIPNAARRRLLYAAVAGAATVAGLSLAWWNQKLNLPSGAARLALWDLSFASPGRPDLPMQTFAGKPLLLNFWATWCPPCVEELPLLDGFYIKNSSNGWQVLGLAVDKESAVQHFLKQAPVRFPIALAGMAGIELSKTLGNFSGGLPFTVVLGSAGQVLHRRMGRISTEDLLLWSALK